MQQLELIASSDNECLAILIEAEHLVAVGPR